MNFDFCFNPNTNQSPESLSVKKNTFSPVKRVISSDPPCKDNNA